MSVKKKDRHLARKAPLQKSRALMDQVLILTRSPSIDDCGKQLKGGMLGSGQAYDAYGRDLLALARKAHRCCYEAGNIYVKNKDSLAQSEKYYNAACDSYRLILADLDFCLYHFATSQKKIKSVKHLIYLTYDALKTTSSRMEHNKTFVK